MDTNISLKTEGNSTGILQESPDSTLTQLIIIKTFSITIATLGTLSNSIMIVAILYGRLFHNSIYVKILNLLVCNLIHSSVFLPLIALQAFTDIWTDKSIVCKLFSYGLFCNLGTELFGYVCISLNRYFCIINQRVYSILYGSRKALLVEWILPWLIYPIILAFPLFGIFSHYEYVPQKLVCHPFLGQECTGYCLFVFLFALTTTLPVIGFCYLRIIIKYIQIQRKTGASRDSHSKLQDSHIKLGKKNSNDITNETFDNGVAIVDNQTTAISHRNVSCRRRSELKMAFTIFGIILFFGMCRIPFMTLYMYDPSMSKVDPLIHTLVIYIGSNINWINPILYALTNKQIRKALLKMTTAFKVKLRQ